MKLILLSICALALIRTSSSSDTCKDHFNCQIYPRRTCKTDEWVILNCPKKCNECSTQVNPLVGWQASPTTTPDISINAPFRDYTYPKPDEPSTATIHAEPLPAASALAPVPPAYPASASAPAPTAAYPTEKPTAAYVVPTNIPAFKAPVPAVAYPTSAAYPASPQAYAAAAAASSHPAPAQPPSSVYGMPTSLPPTSNQYAAAEQPSLASVQTNESSNWVVKIPPKVQESLQNRPETIRISFVKQHSPVYSSDEVNINPKNGEGLQTVKISFIEENPAKPIPHGLSQVSSPQPQLNSENIRLSFREPQSQTPFQPMGDQNGQNETGPNSSAPQRDISVSFMGHENETFSVPPASASLERNITVAFTGHENETVSVPLVKTIAALPERNISVDLNGNHQFSMPVNGQGAEDVVNQVMNGARQRSRNISISFLKKPFNPGQVTVESNGMLYRR